MVIFVTLCFPSCKEQLQSQKQRRQARVRQLMWLVNLEFQRAICMHVPLYCDPEYSQRHILHHVPEHMHGCLPDAVVPTLCPKVGCLVFESIEMIIARGWEYYLVSVVQRCIISDSPPIKYPSSQAPRRNEWRCEGRLLA